MNYIEKVAEGLLKSLVSGDPLQVNRKYRDPVTLRPTAKLAFSTNELPTIADRSDGVWRRMIAMPFLAQFKAAHQYPKWVEKLREELPGIFNWALRGARRLYKRGRFTRCGVCRRAVEDYRRRSDPFFVFAKQECEIGKENSADKQSLYRCYAHWCESNGLRPTSSAKFNERVLDLRGVQVRRPGADR